MLAASLTAILLVCVFLGQSRLDAQTPFARFGRVTSMDGGRDATLHSRLITDRAAWDVVNRNPFIGAGLDGVSSYTVTGMQVHNLLLGSWFQSGLLGLIGMLLMLIAIARYAWHSLAAAANREEYSTAVALAASLVAFAAFSMSSPGLYQRHAWVAAALCIAFGTQKNH
jgi:O-antigen ligase